MHYIIKKYPSVMNLWEMTSETSHLLCSTEYILMWCSCGTKAEIFELSRVTANLPPLPQQQIPPPLLIFSGSPQLGNWTPFDSNLFTVIVS